MAEEEPFIYVKYTSGKGQIWRSRLWGREGTDLQQTETDEAL